MNNPAPGFLKHPQYQVDIKPLAATLTVEVNGQEIARSERAVAVEETKHKPVWYIPLEDIDPSLIQATETETYCPFKGYASYWRVCIGEEEIEDAIWAYMNPFDECLALKEYASFYTNKVTVLINNQAADASGPGWIDR